MKHREHEYYNNIIIINIVFLTVTLQNKTEIFLVSFNIKRPIPGSSFSLEHIPKKLRQSSLETLCDVATFSPRLQVILAQNIPNDLVNNK